MARPRILYISPTIPDPGGTGLAIRAHHVLDALLSRYDVYLLVVHQRFTDRPATKGLMARCKGTAFLPVPFRREPWILLRQVLRIGLPRIHYSTFSKPAEWIYLTEGRMKALDRVFCGTRFDAVHLLRLYTFPIHQRFPYPERPRLIQLDLDDIESRTRLSLSRLHGLAGHRRAAAAMLQEARWYADVERQVCPRMDRLFVGSDLDRSYLCAHSGSLTIEVLPNVVEIPDRALPKRRCGPFSFLFVGALNYYPNEEGILYFCRRVLPEVRRETNSDVRVRVAGRGASIRLRRRLEAIPGVVFLGGVPEAGPLYGEADAAVVPIRAGGGTRIKILEAFAHKCPVVSTHLGAEGIRARHGTHLLLGSTTGAFVRQCLRLIGDPELGRRLCDEAFQLVATGHAPWIMRRILAPEDPPARGKPSSKRQG